ncbi:MAG: M20/M25/M40 family metallo-hydrolase [Betaproteobacteria bacterium]|nr:M20/M25/M40 family metallo-hydrolase [Betaproteobacteria bacterium]
MKLPLLALLAFLPITQAAADSFSEQDLKVAKQAITRAQASDLAYELVASLTSEVGPRPAGSANDAKAVAWGKAKLATLGFDRVWTEPVKIDGWARVSERAEIVAPYPQVMAVTSLGNSISTPDAGINAEIAYYENLEQLKSDTSDRAKGRIAFIDSVFVRSRDGRGYGKAVPTRFAGATEAGKHGAIAVLIRSIGTDHDRLAHTGSMRYDEKVAAPIPAAAVSNPDADMIVRQLKSGKPVRVALMLKNEFKSGLESHNVLAEIRGSQWPDQIIAIGGHLDSWDLGTGAIDDGAGVAITVAALKMIQESGVRPKRTIRVILFANEENGIDGANAYAAAHGKEKHQLIGESDLGSGKIYQISTNVREAALPVLREIAAVIAPLGIELGDNSAGGGADLGPLIRQYSHPSVALAQDASEYFDIHHTANDTLDKINPVTLKQNVAAWSALIWLAAQAEVEFGPSLKK